MYNVDFGADDAPQKLLELKHKGIVVHEGEDYKEVVRFRVNQGHRGFQVRETACDCCWHTASQVIQKTRKAGILVDSKVYDIPVNTAIASSDDGQTAQVCAYKHAKGLLAFAMKDYSMEYHCSDKFGNVFHKFEVRFRLTKWIHPSPLRSSTNRSTAAVVSSSEGSNGACIR